MAMLAYTGLQGHGKTYEVVRSVIIPAVRDGRRVVTNIAGLQPDKIKAYALKGAKEKTFADMGDIVMVSNLDVVKPNFFPVEDSDNKDSIVKGGDIVVLDECWRWYVTGEKLPQGHLTFFRMHRHFLHPKTGITCDVVFIVQVLDDLQRTVRGTVEKSFLMSKHKDLGMDTKYIVQVFSGKRQNKASMLNDYQESYDPEVYALYKSYSQSSTNKGVEKSADKRGNILFQRKIIYGIPFLLIFGSYSVHYVYGFFHPQPKQQSAPSSVFSTKSTKQASTASAPLPSKSSGPQISKEWRVVGFVNRGNVTVFILSDSQGRIRHYSHSGSVAMFASEVEITLPNGDIVTTWSGSEPEKRGAVHG